MTEDRAAVEEVHDSKRVILAVQALEYVKQKVEGSSVLAAS